MAHQIKFNKERSERGYRLYRLEDTDIGIRATNFSQRTKFSSWKIELVSLYIERNKTWASPYNQLKLLVIPGGTWSEFYLNKVRDYIKNQPQDFFDWLFSASFPKR